MITFAPNSLAPPFVIWESANDLNSKDTVTYVADKNYAPGEDICAKSARNRYPIWIKNTNTDTLYAKDTLFVHDIVTSRLFLGGGPYKNGTFGVGAPVYMSLTALNYDINQQWNCIFRTKDTTEQVMDLVVSNDGNHLFILTKKSSGNFIYRVSGFDRYRDIVELDACKAVYDASSGLNADNDRRMLKDDTLLLGTTSDVLSIALDPQNNENLIFTTNDIGGIFPRINLITNAQTATLSSVNITPKEGNGIPERMPVYTAFVEMTHSNIASIGTETGIYKTEDFTSPTPAWTLYNSGIDMSVPVFKLYQQTKNIPGSHSITYSGTGDPAKIDYPGVSNYGVIYAATHGAGLFVDSTYLTSTGINRYEPNSKSANENTLKVYPNPANSYFSIDYTLTSSNEQVQLNIVDITGKIIYTKNLGLKQAGSHSERLNSADLPNGFYFVNMMIGQYNKTAKIIISK
jgi:hypothetical protein